MDRFETQKHVLEELVKHHHSYDEISRDLEELVANHPEAAKISTAHEIYEEEKCVDDAIEMKRWGLPR